MRLSELLRHLHGPGTRSGPDGGTAATVEGDLAREIRAVVHDSRKAGPDDVFVAIRGGTVDGRDFVPGLDVAAVIADGEVDAEPGVTVIQVDDARKALARASAAVAGHPSRSLPVVGLTGTNGKTTTSLMLEAIATGCDAPVGVIGTTGHRIAGHPIPAVHTTPEAPVIQDLLARMRDEHCKLAVMEVSSIGLAQRRVDGIDFAAAAFTSFSQDHLDFHGTMEAYLAAKLRLFSELLRTDGVAIISGRDPVADRFAEAAGDRRTWRYGHQRPDEDEEAVAHLDLAATDVLLGPEGSSAHVRTPAGEGDLLLPMVGAHNLDNALAALGCALAVGLSLQTCLDALADLAPLPGRLERIPDPSGSRVVLVDYAHTPDALVQVIEACRSTRPARLLLVFGCGGDRDPGKRPQMGQIAAVGASRTWITSDNPRSEDPADIARDVLAGVPGFARDDVEVVLDRRAAIDAAIAAAGPGDLVLITGKGHETTQIIGEEALPFDDRAVAREALAAHRSDPRERT